MAGIGGMQSEICTPPYEKFSRTPGNEHRETEKHALQHETAASMQNRQVAEQNTSAELQASSHQAEKVQKWHQKFHRIMQQKQQVPQNGRQTAHRKQAIGAAGSSTAAAEVQKWYLPE